MKEYQTRDEMIAAIFKPGWKVAEVGVFTGEFADVILATKPASLTLIDTWSDWCCSGNADGNDVRWAYLPDAWVRLQRKAKETPELTLHRGFSFEELEKYPDDWFDAIYIDADHSYEGCKADLEVAHRKIRPGGILAGHDYRINPAKCNGNYAFGVGRAVDEYLEQRRQKIAALGCDGCVSFAIEVRKSADTR